MIPPSQEPLEPGAAITVPVPAGLTQELVTGYISRCRSGLPSLLAAVDASDFEAARVYGHRMKGSGGAYGIPGLSEIGAEIERAAKAHDPASIHESVSTLQAYLGRLSVEPQPK